MDAQHTDERLRDLCERNSPPFDEAAFADRLKTRTGRSRRHPQEMPQPGNRGTGRCGRERVALLASLAVVLVAAVAVGGLEIAKHLSREEYVLVIDDGSLSPSGADQGLSSGGGSITIRGSQSLSDLSLAAVWQAAATGLKVDPTAVRLSMAWLSLTSEGRLDKMLIRAEAPDGRDISLRGGVVESEETPSVQVRCSAGPSLTGRFTENTFSPDSVFVGLDVFLEALDRAGLDTIVSRSGLDVGDARPTLAFSGYLMPREFVRAGSIIMSADDLVALEPASSIVDVDGEHVKRVEADRLASAPLPALLLGLSLTQETVDSSGGSFQTTSGQASVLLRLPDSATDDEVITAQPVDAGLDGLAFTTMLSDVCLIRGGSTQTLWQHGEDLIARVQHAAAQYGVSYSLGRTLVLRGTDNVPPPVETSDGSLASNDTAELTRSAMAIPIDDPGSPSNLVTLPSGTMLLSMKHFAFEERADRVWLSVISAETGGAQGAVFSQILLTAQPPTADLAPIPLGHPFGGELAVSPDGSTILYIGSPENGAQVTLRTGDTEKELWLDLATAYHPVFSPDGRSVCLAGARGPRDHTSLWMVDLERGDCRQIESTEGLTPTFPAFSPDGKHIAFRDWKLGHIWTVSPDGGELTRYDLVTEDAPIAW